MRANTKNNMSKNLRNIAIIAHVDHGKTTLVDKMIMAGNLIADHQESGDLIMDNNDLVKAVTDVRLKSDVAGAGSLVGALSNRTASMFTSGFAISARILLYLPSANTSYFTFIWTHFFSNNLLYLNAKLPPR